MWKVTIWRIGSGCGYTGYGRTIPKAWANAAHNAGSAYLYGVHANDERYGPDLFSTFIDLCERAAKLIRYKRSCPRVSAGHPIGAAIDIERVK